MDDFPVIDSGLVIGPPFLGFKLLATGQITKYVTGDDGDLEFGEKKAYEILTTGQFSGITAITVNGKTDNHSNNVVKDLKTGLMWSRYVAGSVGPGSDGKLPWTTTGSGATAEGIYPYWVAANLAELAIYSDWRIPNISELKSILNYSLNPLTPDTTAFPSFPNENIFSSTTDPETITRALVQSAYYNSLKTVANYCLLVRGG